MGKLYIFGIGGTGSRVLKSLTMLLASGVDCGVDTIVPIIIDRDMSNSDLSRTKLLIENYIEVNEIAERTDKNRFFRTKIELLKSGLCLQLKANDKKLDDFIEKRTMSHENQALVEMLFSKETLGMDMTVGFQGNPNVGSVVLNQFEDSEVFKNFATDFDNPDNKIIIISSIFGGTGASGFPLLRRVLQTRNVITAEGQELPNWGKVNSAQLGAITVLPYFSVENKTAGDDSLVDANTFIDKAKAALSYYITEDKHLDTMYYIGDKNVTAYEHNKGGQEQRNNAHFVELAAALAVLDFVNPNKKKDNLHRDISNRIIETTYKEFGIMPSEQSMDMSLVSFADLADDTQKTLINPLTRFLWFRQYLKNAFDSQCKKQPYARSRFDNRFREERIIKKMEAVQDSFFEWLVEMEKQNRQFTPFILKDKYPAVDLRGKINIYSVNFWNFLKYHKILGKKGASLLENELNLQLRNINTMENESLFLELFYQATAALINYK